MPSRIIHLKRPGTELTACGDNGPLFIKTFVTEEVTCVKCKKRMPAKFKAPKPLELTPGRVVQPGGGHRR